MAALQATLVDQRFSTTRLLAALGTLFVTALAIFISSCGPRPDNSRVNLPAPVESTAVGVGDLFTLQVVGEKDLPQDYQVAPDGTVDLPFVGRLEVKGLEPQEIAKLVKKELMEREILTNPDVIVSVTEYRSRRVTVLGQVQKPGSFPHTAGMTLLQAVSLAGGFTSIANLDRVNLTRGKAEGGTTTVVISANAIMEGKSVDFPLQAEDRIYVYERVF